MNHKRSLGERIRTERKRLSLTQKQLGERVGLDHNCISRYELNECLPSLETLVLFSKIFNCSLDYLVLGAPKGYPPSLQFALRGLAHQEQEKAIQLLALILDDKRSLK